MQLNPSEISELIKKRLENFDTKVESRTEGTIVSVTDGIVRIHGLSDVMLGEMLEFPGDVYGLAMNLERDSVGAVIMGAYEHLKEGDSVKCTGRILEVPVGEALIGRVVDTLGNPVDGKGEIKAESYEPLEKVAPGVISRQSVSQPVQTGLKSVDSMVPIGRGQRELIIGDRQTGKTAVAIDAIINQKGTGVICIYVAVGQKASSVANVVRKLEEFGAMDHTIVVNAGAAESAAMQFLAPYSGCTMGEYFRDKGLNVLLLMDSVTRFAMALREVGLAVAQLHERCPRGPVEQREVHGISVQVACRGHRHTGAVERGLAQALGGGDRLESGDANADDEDLGGRQGAGRRHHHRQNFIQPFGCQNYRHISSQIGLGA